jgi:hypothetical protein
MKSKASVLVKSLLIAFWDAVTVHNVQCDNAKLVGRAVEDDQ